MGVVVPNTANLVQFVTPKGEFVAQWLFYKNNAKVPPLKLNRYWFDRIASFTALDCPDYPEGYETRQSCRDAGAYYEAIGNKSEAAKLYLRACSIGVLVLNYQVLKPDPADCAKAEVAGASPAAVAQAIASRDKAYQDSFGDAAKLASDKANDLEALRDLQAGYEKYQQQMAAGWSQVLGAFVGAAGGIAQTYAAVHSYSVPASNVPRPYVVPAVASVAQPVTHNGYIPQQLPPPATRCSSVASEIPGQPAYRNCINLAHPQPIPPQGSTAVNPATVIIPPSHGTGPAPCADTPAVNVEGAAWAAGGEQNYHPVNRCANAPTATGGAPGVTATNNPAPSGSGNSGAVGGVGGTAGGTVDQNPSDYANPLSSCVSMTVKSDPSSGWDYIATNSCSQSAVITVSNGLGTSAPVPPGQSTTFLAGYLTQVSYAACPVGYSPVNYNGSAWTSPEQQYRCWNGR